MSTPRQLSLGQYRVLRLLLSGADIERMVFLIEGSVKELGLKPGSNRLNYVTEKLRELRLLYRVERTYSLVLECFRSGDFYFEDGELKERVAVVRRGVRLNPERRRVAAPGATLASELGRR